jgi:hypothetical protein
MFASRSIPVHLLRGALGISALVAFAALAPARPLLALPLLAFALVALRGCPACWLVGLLQTALTRVKGAPTSGVCTDGSCSRRPRGP